MSTFNSPRSLAFFSSLLIASLVWLAPKSMAQTNTTPRKSVPPPASQVGSRSQEEAAPAKKARPIPFHGTLASVTPSAKTITVGKRTFQLTAETKIYKGDKKSPGALSDARIGGNVTGSYFKSPDGKLLARSVYFKPAEIPVGTVAGSSTVPKKK